jgi:hypothetical protein
MKLAQLGIVVLTAACSKGSPTGSPPPLSTTSQDPLASRASQEEIRASQEEIRESMLDAFAADRIPNTARATSAQNGLRAWTWQGAAKKASGQRDPFSTTVTVTAVRIDPADGDASTYSGLVAWDCTGDGPFRCFENRFSHEETRLVYEANGRHWKALETRHVAR